MPPNDEEVLDRREGKEIHLVFYDKHGFYFPVESTKFTYRQADIFQTTCITMGEVLIQETDTYQLFIVFQMIACFKTFLASIYIISNKNIEQFFDYAFVLFYELSVNLNRQFADVQIRLSCVTEISQHFQQIGPLGRVFYYLVRVFFAQSVMRGKVVSKVAMSFLNCCTSVSLRMNFNKSSSVSKEIYRGSPCLSNFL